MYCFYEYLFKSCKFCVYNINNNNNNDFYSDSDVLDYYFSNRLRVENSQAARYYRFAGFFDNSLLLKTI